MSGKSPGPDTPGAELRRRIDRAGTIGFDEFMAAALYHPRGGYYAVPTPRTGQRGDFFTSVSVGPVFGRLLAAQFADMWDQLGRPADFTLVEQGASDGQLMADVLSAMAQDRPECQPRVILIEPLPVLRAAQERTLARWSGRLTTCATEDELPLFTGVFFANELLDAFPVKLLVRDGPDWQERRVGVAGDDFVFVEEPIRDPELLRVARALPLPSEGPRFCTEVCPSLAPWMRTMASKLSRGWLLLIDYGHPAAIRHAPPRADGTLAAYRQHARMEHPLADPGTQDLTAHVDFTAVARAGLDAGLQLAGFTDQHHALAALAARLYPAMPEERLSPGAAREMRALRQLLHPESMGTSFKFLALARGTEAPPAAFRFARDPHRELLV
jgi:SAM-dependent MidA family methyltransferase